LLATGLAAPLGAGATEEEKIEAVIAAVIEAYRKGDYATMGRYYAPEVSVVPSDYNPPLIGWANVEPRYQQANANVSGMELVRESTRIVRKDKIAWAVYQWRFAGIIGNQAFEAQGHTTLILEKRKRDWVIVHNHTSALPMPPAPPRSAPEKPPS
jgi:ketosteroid isomerase-like protein